MRRQQISNGKDTQQQEANEVSLSVLLWILFVLASRDESILNPVVLANFDIIVPTMKQFD